MSTPHDNVGQKITIEPQPTCLEEADRRARGELWLSTDGQMRESRFWPPHRHVYVRLDDCPTSIIGKRVIAQTTSKTWMRGLYVVGDATIGHENADPTNRALIVPVVRETKWWAHKLTNSGIPEPEGWMPMERMWLDESEGDGTSG